MDALDAAALLRQARTRAGLTQRALAERAGTSQSVVARVEGGVTDPGVGTLARLLAAAGAEARVALVDHPAWRTWPGSGPIVE